MTRSLRHLLLIIAAFTLSCESQPIPPSSKTAPAVVTPEPRVVIFLIDGIRWQDSFGDPAHTHIPGMWNDLRPQGALCSNFRNLGWTLTNPGHGSILSGVWQFIANDGSQRPANPTMFEYYRQQKSAPAADVFLVSEKPKLDAVAYSTDPAYGAAYGAAVDFSNASDFDTYDALIARLQSERPHFVMASFSEVDLHGHAGVYGDYLRAIEVVDSLAVLTWNYLQSDPQYAGRTTMIITADHGRHDDAHGGFQNHGDTCDGCQHIPCIALGPNIRAGYDVTTLYTQRDLCTTVGSILGVATPQSQGARMSEIFVPVQTGVGN